jgi:thiol:disulfide interchange protein DsbA
MRHRFPILICTLLLAACGSHPDSGHAASDNASSSPASPATAAAATPTMPAAASTQAPATPASSASTNTGTPAAAADNTATATNSAPADSEATGNSGKITAAERASAEAVYNKGVGKWVQGKNYFLINPTQPKASGTSKVEVVEIFSWGCPACNQAHLLMDSIHKSLPTYATMDYLPASFRPDENWVVYQRAFYAAQALGLARKSYDAVFDATWKTGELASYNLSAGSLKPRADWPKIDTFAEFFAKKYGIKASDFLAVAHSFSVNIKMKRADQLVKSYGVGGTPTLVVNGKYRYGPSTAGGYAQTIELTQWLVAKEQAGK